MRNSCRFTPYLLVHLSMLFSSAALSLSALTAALPARAQSAVTAQNKAESSQAMQSEGLAAMLGSASLSEDALEHALVGKTLYLRSGYMDNSLEFDETGKLQAGSPSGSFTLALIRIDKVKFNKKRLELEGIRYGLHFRGELPTEDFSANTDEVCITPKKKKVKITIARQQVVKPKKKRGNKAPKASEQGNVKDAEVDKLQPPEEQEKTVTQQQADSLMRAALNRIVATRIDDRLVATMPAAWQSFFEAAHRAQNSITPERGVLSPTEVDQQARLTAPVEPSSNEFAQKAGIAGMALYHVVVDTSGKADRIEVARPIGFGLDENAVKAIEQAKFQPAIKNGKPVLAEVDVVVQFRIYSKRTNVVAPADESAGIKKAVLPGPYSVPRS